MEQCSHKWLKLEASHKSCIGGNPNVRPKFTLDSSSSSTADDDSKEGGDDEDQCSADESLAQQKEKPLKVAVNKEKEKENGTVRICSITENCAVLATNDLFWSGLVVNTMFVFRKNVTTKLRHCAKHCKNTSSAKSRDNNNNNNNNSSSNLYCTHSCKLTSDVSSDVSSDVRIGSITSRCSGKRARALSPELSSRGGPSLTGPERAEEIKPRHHRAQASSLVSRSTTGEMAA